jgi:hypothetical protein
MASKNRTSITFWMSWKVCAGRWRLSLRRSINSAGSVKGLKSAALSTAVFLSGCSLFGPPIPASPIDSAALAEFEARPLRARDAVVACVRDYATKHGHSPGIQAELVVDSALYACREPIDAYRRIAVERAKGGPRVLGWIDRSDARSEKAVEDMIIDARTAALDALIQVRSRR